MATNFYKDFIECNHPELLDEFELFKKDHKKIMAEKKKKEQEEAKKNNHFYQYGWYYEIESSYKGYTDSTREYEIPFRCAFALLQGELPLDSIYEIDFDNSADSISFREFIALQSSCDLPEKINRDDYSNQEEYEEDLYNSLNEYNETLNIFESEFKKLLFDNHHCIDSFLFEKDDPGFCRVVNTYPDWYGTTIWSKSAFKQIFEELQTMRFKPFKGEINSFEC